MVNSNTIEITDGIGEPGEPVLAYGELNASIDIMPQIPGHHQYGAQGGPGPAPERA